MSHSETDKKQDVICGCSGTTVEQILRLLAQGCNDLEKLSRITGAVSGCGGCEFDLQVLINSHKSTLMDN